MDSGNIGRSGEKYLAYFMEQLNIEMHKCYRDEIGIDAYFEIYDIEPGNLFAGQVKSGESFFQDDFCYYYDTDKKHIDTWLNFNIPVYLFIFEPNNNEFYYYDIQKYIIENFQNEHKGFTFKFPKDSNRLSINSKHNIIQNIRSKSNSFNDSFSKSYYYFNTFKDVSLKFANSYKEIDSDNVLIDIDIKNWLKKSGFIIKDKSFYNSLVSIIRYHHLGLGIIGLLLEDSQSKNLSVFPDRLFITYMNGKRSGCIANNSLYDYDACKRFFIDYTVKDNSGIKTAKYNNSEIIIFEGPITSTPCLRIHKVETKIDISEANNLGYIDPSINKLLASIIKSKSNILITGSKILNIDTVTSALTSLFKSSEEVLLIEERRDIYVYSGIVTSILKDINLKNNSNLKEVKDTIDNIRFDRLVVNMGNYIMDDTLPYIVDIVQGKKGCLVVYSLLVSSIFDIFLELGKYSDNKLHNEKDYAKIFVENFSYIINVTGGSNCRYISNLWKIEDNDVIELYNKKFIY